MPSPPPCPRCGHPTTYGWQHDTDPARAPLLACGYCALRWDPATMEEVRLTHKRSERRFGPLKVAVTRTTFELSFVTKYPAPPLGTTMAHDDARALLEHCLAELGRKSADPGYERVGPVPGAGGMTSPQAAGAKRSTSGPAAGKKTGGVVLKKNKAGGGPTRKSKVVRKKT